MAGADGGHIRISMRLLRRVIFACCVLLAALAALILFTESAGAAGAGPSVPVPPAPGASAQVSVTAPNNGPGVSVHASASASTPGSHSGGPGAQAGVSVTAQASPGGTGASIHAGASSPPVAGASVSVTTRTPPSGGVPPAPPTNSRPAGAPVSGHAAAPAPPPSSPVNSVAHQPPAKVSGAVPRTPTTFSVRRIRPSRTSEPASGGTGWASDADTASPVRAAREGNGKADSTRPRRPAAHPRGAGFSIAMASALARGVREGASSESALPAITRGRHDSAAVSHRAATVKHVAPEHPLVSQAFAGSGSVFPAAMTLAGSLAYQQLRIPAGSPQPLGTLPDPDGGPLSGAISLASTGFGSAGAVLLVLAGLLLLMGQALRYRSGRLPPGIVLSTPVPPG